MAVYTNMTWPEDPYGTGQLWRKEPALLAAFAALCVDDGDRAVPVSYAVVYLRLRRIQAVDVTDAVSFGFRAVSAVDPAGLPELVRLFDLDTMRARRLAKIVAGHQLADDLHAIGALAHGDVGRGVRALANSWPTRFPADAGADGKTMAYLFDVALAKGDDLAGAAAAAGIDLETVCRAFEPQRTLDLLFETIDGMDSPGAPVLVSDQAQLVTRAEQCLAACATERALITALAGGRHLQRYTWSGALDVGAALADNVQGCFPTPDLATSG